MAVSEVARAEFSLSYDGPALADGRMEVRELAPSLLALGEMLQEANATTFPAAPPVALEIRAFGRGSFDVVLNLAQQAEQLAGGIIAFFNLPVHTALNNLVVEVALVIAVLKRGQQIVNREPVGPGVTRLTFANGTTLEIPSAVVELLAKEAVRRYARDVVNPLRRPGVERLRIQPADQEAVVVEKGDVDAFDAQLLEEQPLVDQETEMALSITTLSFQEKNKWRLSDGQSTFYAAIEDENFLKRIDAGEPFAKGDILRCRVRIRQWRTDGSLRAEYTVTQVLQHIPRTQVLPLPFPS
jgi:hypothetical protein